MVACKKMVERGRQKVRNPLTIRFLSLTSGVKISRTSERPTESSLRCLTVRFAFPSVSLARREYYCVTLGQSLSMNDEKVTNERCEPRVAHDINIFLDNDRLFCSELLYEAERMLLLDIWNIYAGCFQCLLFFYFLTNFINLLIFGIFHE